MAFYDKFPYTNFQELNLDKLMQKVGEVDRAKEAAEASAEAADQSASNAAVSEQQAADYASAAHASEVNAGASAEAAADSATAADLAAQETAAQVDTVNTRLDSLIVDGQQTAGNSELIDIRAGGDGFTYPLAGDATRGMYDAINRALNLFLGTYFGSSYRIPHMAFTDGYYINTVGSILADPGYSYAAIPVTAGEVVHLTTRYSGTICSIGYAPSVPFASVTPKVSGPNQNVTRDYSWTVDADGYAVVCGLTGEIKVSVDRSTYFDYLKSLLNSEYLHALMKIVNNNNYQSELPDMDTAPRNSCIVITSGISSIANIPADFPTGGGTLITACPFSDYTGTLQILIASNGKNVYYRNRWAGWNNWNAMPDPELDKVLSWLDVLSAFRNITCCGDSLTYSQVFTGSATSRMAYNPYPVILSKKTGAVVSSLAVPGYSAGAWWDAYANMISQKEAQLAIIYLGTNEGLTDTLDTDAPAGTDPAQWNTNHTGSYAKIIQAFKDRGARVLLVKCYATSGTGSSDLAATNACIEHAAQRFGCGLIENERLEKAAYHSWPNQGGSNPVHYNDLGYAAFTEYLMHQIASMPSAYLQNIIPA